MLSKIDLNAMLVFCKVAELKSFTRSADDLGIKKSTASNKIAILENQLGSRLLTRNTRHVSLTEAGENYYRYCKEITDKALAANDLISKSNNEPEGTLRITATPGIGRILFDDLFSVFMKEYPQINIELNLSYEPADIIRESFDLAIRASEGGQLKDSSLIAKKLFNVELGLFASPAYLENHKAIKTIRDIERHQFIQPYKRNIVLHKNGKDHEIEVKNHLIINYLDACIKAVSDALGIGIFPASSVTKEVSKGKLIRVLPEYNISPTTLFLVYPSKRLLPPKLSVFLDFIESWKKPFV